MMRLITPFILSTLAFSEALVPLTKLKDNALTKSIDRRSWLSGASLAILSSSSSTVAIQPSQALVYTDPDRYGDKELKVALVNKLRQNLRNAITEDPSLAPKFVELAIQDALTFDSSSQKGGPDGSILLAVLNDDRSELAALKPAALVLLDVASKTQRTTEITRADLVSFAGAEAIETMGGPRCPVQIGKLDPGTPYKSAVYPDLSNGSAALGAFRKAGMNARDVALLYGAIGAMKLSVETLQAKKKENVDDDEGEFEENEMGDPEVIVPTSFGAPSEIYGKRLGVMDSKVFVGIVNDLKQKRTPFPDVFSNPDVSEWASTYAKKRGAFAQDLPLAYQRLVSIGQTYTGGKVGSLLGKGENQI